MIFNSISSPRRRIAAFVAAVFFTASVYLCVTRLSSMSFTREPFHGDKAPVDKTPVDEPKTDTTSGEDKPDTPDKPDEPSKPRPHVDLIHADLPMSYGDFDRPGFDGVTLMGSVPDVFVPTLENGRRLVVVGDIHGMDAELEDLLGKVGFNAASDHLVATGDMISKGHDSTGVVSRLMNLNASAVRGNHEDRVLLAHAELHSAHGVSADLDNTEAEESKGELQELVVARSLSREQLDWLAKLPVILTVDPLPIYVVHAGLVPGVDLAQQDPWAVMNMRTLVYPRQELREKEGEEPRVKRRDEPGQSEDEPALESLQKKVDGEGDNEQEEAGDNDMDTSGVPFDRQIAVPNDGHKGEKWSDAWDSHQLRLHRRQRRTVIYGHDAQSGYKESRYAIGLDSGCVKGDDLTALVIEATEGGGFTHTTTQTKCQAP